MSSLIISMIETELDALRAHRAGARLEADFRDAGLALLQELPAGFRELGQLARLVMHEIFGRHACEHQRRKTLRQVAARRS